MQVPTDKAAIGFIPPGQHQQVTGVLDGHMLPSCKNLPKIKKGRHVGKATMSESLAISVGGRRCFG
jgi:hypothetical protein